MHGGQLLRAQLQYGGVILDDGTICIVTLLHVEVGRRYHQQQRVQTREEEKREARRRHGGGG